MDPLSSAEAFTRALKSSESSTFKINLAAEAWISTSLYLPGRHSLIADWILQQLVDERTNKSIDTPTFDLRYWSLLDRILLSTEIGPPNVWLLPILGRRKVSALLSTMISRLADLTDPQLVTFATSVFRTCFTTVPPKPSDEQAQELFWDILKHWSSRGEQLPHSGSVELSTLAIETFRSKAPSIKDKKKLYSTFVEYRLKDWLVVLSQPVLAGSPLRQLIYEAGEDILFKSHEGLKFALSPRDTASPESNIDLFTVLFSLIRSSDSSDGPILPLIVPLFKSFLTSVYKTKEDLSEVLKHTKVTPQTKLKVAAMDFLGKLSDNTLSVPTTNAVSDVSVRILETRVSLFRLALDEDLLDTKDPASVTVLLKEIKFSIDALQIIGLQDGALGLLSIFAKFDYYVIEQDIQRILTGLSKCPISCHPIAHEFLRNVLAYHTKTRTVDAHVKNLVECIAYLSYTSPFDVYREVSIGPLFGGPYQDELRASISSYLAPSQALDVARRLKEMSRLLLAKCDVISLAEIEGQHSDRGEGSSRAGDQLPSCVHITDASSASVALALLIKIMAIVLPALPFASLAGVVLDEVHRTVEDIRHLFGRSMASSLADKLLVRAAKGKEKTSKSKKRMLREMTLLSSLRLGYALDALAADPAVIIRRDADTNSGLDSKLVQIMRLDGVLPELQIEIARTILSKPEELSPPSTSLSNRPQSDASDVIDAMLDCIESSCKAKTAREESWNGQAANIDNSQMTSAIGMFDMLLGRWLHIFENSAPRSAFGRAAHLIVRFMDFPPTLPSDAAPLGITMQDVAHNCVTSTDFLEMKELRASVWATVMEITSKIQDASASELIHFLPLIPGQPSWAGNRTHKTTASPTVLGQEIDDQVRAFRTILCFPEEYVTKAVRPELLKRAMTLDVFSSYSSQDRLTKGDPIVGEWWAVLRTVALRLSEVQTQAVPPEVLQYYTLSLRYCVSDNPASWWMIARSCTLDLLDKSHRYAVLSLNQRNNAVVIEDILSDYVDLPTIFDIQMDLPTKDVMLLTRRSLLNLLEVYADSASETPTISSTMSKHIKTLTSRLSDWLTTQGPQRLTLSPTDIQKHASNIGDSFYAWRVYLRLIRQTSSGVLALPPGGSMAPSMLALAQDQTARSPLPSDLFDAYLSLLLEEILSSDDESAQTRVEVAVVCFLVFIKSSMLTKDGMERLCSSMRGSICKWSPTLYAATAQLIEDHLHGLYRGLQRQPDVKEVEALLRLSDAMIRSAPTGTGKASHSLLIRAITIVSGDIRLGGASSRDVGSTASALDLTFHVLTFLSSVSREKSALLDDVGMGYILSIFIAVLAPATAATTFPSNSNVPSASALYHLICSSLTSLIRTQRGRLASHSPDLTKALCLMVNALKVVQEPPRRAFWLSNPSVTVTEKEKLSPAISPWWITLTGAPEHRLQLPDAKQLNRVLKSMELKTLAVSGGPQTRSDRKSMATAFSRFAPFVLSACIKTITSSYGVRSSELTTLDRPTRRAIEEGLFGLCGMIGDHGRDWVMRSLGEDGKEVFKDMWIQYGKQRYTGTG